MVHTSDAPLIYLCYTKTLFISKFNLHRGARVFTKWIIRNSSRFTRTKYVKWCILKLVQERERERERERGGSENIIIVFPFWPFQSTLICTNLIFIFCFKTTVLFKWTHVFLSIMKKVYSQIVIPYSRAMIVMYFMCLFSQFLYNFYPIRLQLWIVNCVIINFFSVGFDIVI